MQECEQNGLAYGIEAGEAETDRQTDSRMGRGQKNKEETKHSKEIRRRERNAQNVSVTGGINANVKNSLHVSSWSISAGFLTVTFRQYMRVNGAEQRAATQIHSFD